MDLEAATTPAEEAAEPAESAEPKEACASGASLRFTEDWFSHAIPALAKHLRPLVGKASLRALEIGSYEGRSTCWLLTSVFTHKSARVVCVDPHFRPVFDSNIEALQAARRVVKICAPSAESLPLLRAGSFDFISIDGSHRARSVMHDAVESWRVARVGAVVHFDDYRWDGIAEESPSHPKHALDRFGELVGPDAELLHRGYTLILRKIARRITIDVDQAMSEYPNEWPSQKLPKE